MKVDFCGGDAPQNTQHLSLDPQERYTAICNAIKATGRDDVRLNVCRWDYPGTWVHDVAFSWRTTHDINNSWGSVKGILAENLYMSAYCYDGHFNDMDMLEVGRSLSTEEDKTHFGMWCIMNSPLLIGCDMANIRSDALTLLKNKELISLNQDTLYQQAYVVGKTNDCYILVKDVETLNGLKRAFAIYNPNDAAKNATVKFTDLCLGGMVKLRDLFQRKDIGEFTEKYEVSIPAHGTRIYMAEAESRLERKRYEAETAYISDYQELKNNQAERTGVYEYADYCSCGLKAGWLGYSEQNDLQFRDVYSDEGGKYTLTIGYISGEARNIRIDVNGQRVQTVSVNSGGWQTVGKRNVNVTLQKGRNTIRLSNPTGWMPDIDYIDLVSNTPSDIQAMSLENTTNTESSFDLLGRPYHSNARIIVQNGKKILSK